MAERDGSTKRQKNLVSYDLFYFYNIIRNNRGNIDKRRNYSHFVPFCSVIISYNITLHFKVILLLFLYKRNSLLSRLISFSTYIIVIQGKNSTIKLSHVYSKKYLDGKYDIPVGFRGSIALLRDPCSLPYLDLKLSIDIATESTRNASETRFGILYDVASILSLFDVEPSPPPSILNISDEQLYFCGKPKLKIRYTPIRIVPTIYINYIIKSI